MCLQVASEELVDEAIRCNAQVWYIQTRSVEGIERLCGGIQYELDVIALDRRMPYIPTNLKLVV